MDPLAGSYYVEALTDRLEAEAQDLIEEIDALGGSAVAVEKGYFQEAIARSAYDLQRAQESGAVTVVGVNRFTDDAPAAAVPAPDFSELEARQRQRLTEARARRKATAVKSALDAVRTAARGTGPIMPLVVEAVRVRAGVGEISDVLREIWGVYRA